ncbi:MAG: sulfatase [Planctomycetes bacterium]|nr:sulfatase [Planctomycetota bacterium]
MPRPSRREFLTRSAGCSLLFGAFPALGAQGAAPKAKLNVLFIAVDDLRPQLGCYGVKHIKSPNLDKLAGRGIVFNRAYCQQAVCSPSRTSLLTGRRPDTTRIYDLQTHFRKTIPDVVTLPQHFKAHGYHCQAFSKIYHGGLDDPASWSVPHRDPGKPMYGKPETLAELQKQREKLKAEEKGPAIKVLEKDPKTGTVLKVTPPRFRLRGPSWEDPDVPDNALADGAAADMAIEALRQLKDKPFFLAVGFLKPHLPFVAPKRYFDLYPPGSVSLADNPFPPKDCPPIALTTWGELRAYSDIPKQGKLPDEKALELVRAYHAATSYTDAQIGRILDELDKLGIAEKTVVVVWGDHGWHLGEHGLWCKHTNFEVATRSPLIFRAPGQKKPGAKTDALAEFVDIYPTLCELCGLPLPDGLEGTSLAPLLDDPARPWKKAAFSQYPRGKAMGYSLRTDRHRYTEWQENRKAVARELYDYQADPAGNANIADKPENKDLVAQLSKLLNDGWRAALPPKL